MSSLLDPIRSFFSPVQPLAPGLYHYQAPPEAEYPYRLHLRLEPAGNGVLVVNASTVLHLNHTAAEYAYYLVKGTSTDDAARAMARRYRVSGAQARQDYLEFTERIKTLLSTQDLDPVQYLDFGRTDPHTTQVSAPLRLDCALTYRLPAGAAARAAPVERVTQELSTAQWQAVMDKAWAAGIPHVIFTGGEPTLRDDLVELIAHTERVGQVVGLLTDGLRLAEAAYLQTLLQSGLDHLLFLLQPVNDLSWQALDNVLAADLAVTVHLTLTPELADTFPAVLAKLKERGVQHLSLSAASPSLREALQAARDRAAQLALTLVWDLPVPYSGFNPIALETETMVSGAGRTWLYVEPDGDVLPAQGQNRVLGNFVSQPWAELWQKAQADANRHAA
jgi:organic radical activating enzyme